MHAPASPVKPPHPAQRGSAAATAKDVAWKQLVPKSVLTLRKGYTLATFLQDLLAGVTVGLVALPLAMAFAISSGLKPELGIYTAIFAGFLISLLGGSKVQIGGPTG